MKKIYTEPTSKKKHNTVFMYDDEKKRYHKSEK